MKGGALIHFLLSTAQILCKVSSIHGLGVNVGDVVVRPGYSLHINTSTPEAYVISPDNQTVKRLNISTGPRKFHHKKETYNYAVASIVFPGSLIIMKGSTVNVFGENALHVRSLNGEIIVQADIELSCNTTVLSGMCLGGFMPAAISSPALAAVQGHGPGGINQESLVYFNRRSVCLGGSGHGGRGGFNHENSFGSSYGEGDTKNLLGGSAGAYCSQKNITEPGHGGGAIELVADRTITIEASIKANAKQVNGSFNKHETPFSGSSGGLIRLNGTQVRIIGKGSLQATGSSAGISDKCMTTGGSGGIIQIVADKISIRPEAISVAYGIDSPRCVNSTPALPGLIEIRNHSGVLLMSSNNKETFPKKSESFFWPDDPRTTQVTTTTSVKTTKPDYSGWDTFAIQVKRFKHSLSADGTTNSSYVYLLLRNFKELVSKDKLKVEQIKSIIEIFEAFKDVLSRIQDSVSLVRNIAVQLLEIADFCLKPRNQEAWKESEQMLDLARVLESLLAAVAQNKQAGRRNTLYFYGSNMAAQIEGFMDFKGTFFKIANRKDDGNNDDGDNSTWREPLGRVFIPPDALQSANGNASMVLLLYKNLSDFLPPRRDAKGELAVTSILLSCCVTQNETSVRSFLKPAVLEFQLKDQEDGNSFCAFWSHSKSSWSREGLTMRRLNRSRVSCLTNHLTSFAILTQHTKVPVAAKDEFILSILTYIGCGLSIGCLSITLLVFLTFESLSTERHKIHIHLSLAILLAQTMFLSGVNAVQDKAACIAVAVSLHYFFTAAFMWMCVEGVHLYMMVVSVFYSDYVNMKFYYTLGWGVPVIVVGVAALINPNGYGTENTCWISPEDNFIWAFLGPVVVTITVNLIVLARVMKVVIAQASTGNQTADFKTAAAGLKTIIVLLPILGITWLFGLLTVNKDTIFFQYLFTIGNAFQGVFIFLMHCVGSSEVRAAIKRQREKHALRNASDNSALSGTTSQASPTTMGHSKKGLRSQSLGKFREKMLFKKSTKVRPIKSVGLTESDGSGKDRCSKQFEECISVSDIEELKSLPGVPCPLRRRSSRDD